MKREKIQNKTIIILSIPFQRLIRSHLSEDFIKTLINNRKLIIVSPFADIKTFKNEFTHKNIFHINIVTWYIKT